MNAPVCMPLTVYFDGGCPLCRAEIATIAACDREGVLRMVDCAAPGFEDSDVTAAGISRAELMRLLHARDASGRWLRGVEVFALMYRVAGLEAVARVWEHSRLRPVWDRLYPWVARYRMTLSRFGLHHVYALLVRRHVRRISNCKRGNCSVIGSN